MNAVCKTTIAGVVLLFSTQKKLLAQYNPSKYELGVNVGTLVYQGDLAASEVGFTKTLKPAVGLSLSRKFDSYFSVRGNLTFGKLLVEEDRQKDPAYHQLRNFKFSTPVTEISALLVWNIPGENAHKLTYYLMGGAGLSFVKIKRDWSGTDTAWLSEKNDFTIGLGTDTMRSSLPRIVPVIPLGAGLRYQISPAWSVNSELIYRFTPTDYLDGFSHAANAKSKDRYYGISLGISYRFGANKYRCPKVN